jgi:creatinine amidohydrolase
LGKARGWILEEANWKAIRESAFEVAILPWGATEAHNYHLPYGTDTIQAGAVAGESARIATERGARVMVLPPIPYGVQTGQLDIPFCINVNPSTQAALLADIAMSLDGQGVKSLVVLNGHGGNDVRTMIRELQPKVRLFLCMVNWWTCVDARLFFAEPGDHAGELETSMLMHIAPHLVLPLTEAGPGDARPFRVAGLREGWVWAPRQWTQVTDDTGVGDPRASSASKGEAFFEAATVRIAAFLVDLAASDARDMYADAP